MEEQNNSECTASEKAAGAGCILFLTADASFFIGLFIAILFPDSSSLLSAGAVFMGIALVALIAGFISMDISSSSETPEERKQSQAAQQAYINREKYNGLKYTCPMCGSHKIKNIGTAKKVGGVLAVGLASQNVGKNYQCDDCNYKW